MKTKIYSKSICLLMAVFATSVAFGQTVTTVAGKNISGFKNGQDTAARFNRPHDAAVNAVGDIYITDQLNHCIRKVTPSGLVSTFAGSGAAGNIDGADISASFNNPTGVIFDSKGNLFVSDYTNQKIRKITPAGVVSTFAGSGQIGNNNATGVLATFNGPVGMCIDGDDNIFLAEQGGHVIRKITKDAIVTTVAGKYGTFGYGDAKGTKAIFDGPYDVCLDPKGNLYVADQNNHVIRKIDTALNVSLVAGTPGNQGTSNGNIFNARLSLPLSVAYDQFKDLIYFVDYGNNRIRYIDTAGIVYAFAGSNQTYADGVGSAAAFKRPTAIIFDKNRNFIVADHENHFIRKISNPTASIFSISQFADATIFPNPAVNTLSISTKNTLQEVQVLDMLGMLVLSGTSKTMDVSSLPTGNYIVVALYSDHSMERGKLQILK